MKNKQVKQMIGDVIDNMWKKTIDDDAKNNLIFNRAASFICPKKFKIAGTVSLTANQLKDK